MKLSELMKLKVNCFTCGKLRYSYFIDYLHLPIDKNDRLARNNFSLPYFCKCSNDRINIFNERNINIGYWSKKLQKIKFNKEKTFYALNVLFEPYFVYLRVFELRKISEVNNQNQLLLERLKLQRDLRFLELELESLKLAKVNSQLNYKKLCIIISGVF